MDALFEHFNRSYELYGRRLVPVYVKGDSTTPTAARAQAADIAAQGVFGAVTGQQEWAFGARPALIQNLAHAGIVTVTRGSNNALWSDRVMYDPLHPYLWSVFPSSEDLQNNLAALACSALKGHLARNAGDATLQASTRKFGVIALGVQQAPAANVVTDAISSCTGDTVPKVEWAQPSGSPALLTGINQLKASGVTTVICLCESFTFNTAAGQAKSASYMPEWIFSSSGGGTGSDENHVQGMRGASPQLAPPLRLSAGPRLLELQGRPYYGAVMSGNPAVFGPNSDIFGIIAIAEYVYHQLLVLASGIQGAGPQLTSDTFAAALMSTQFPNPGAGRAPYWQPGVGFGAGDHSFYDDYAVAWWSDTAKALDYPASPNDRDSWCYLDTGARYRPGSYPTDADQRLFDADLPCR